jgi:hypothetical protein
MTRPWAWMSGGNSYGVVPPEWGATTRTKPAEPYRSNAADREMVRGAPWKKVPNEATPVQ